VYFLLYFHYTIPYTLYIGYGIRKSRKTKERKVRGYGLPRCDDVENPDVGDIRTYGLKTSIGGRCYQKPFAKRSSRRIWKRKERAVAKKYCKEVFKEEY
jgi:hypothetical protein